MRVRNLKTTMLGVLCAGAVAIGGGREGWDYHWDHPCADDPEGTLICEAGCWCEADWWDENNWLGITYPHEPDDLVRINHSNTGYCSGGRDDGNPCSGDGDCKGGSCEYIEDFVKVNLSTETIWHLTIRTKPTTATDNSLNIRYGGTGTLTLNSSLSLDAEHGPITVKVTDTATLKTD